MNWNTTSQLESVKFCRCVVMALAEVWGVSAFGPKGLDREQAFHGPCVWVLLRA